MVLPAHSILRPHGSSPRMRGTHYIAVDAVEPDLGFAYVDGVAVDDAGFASDIGVGGGWEREED